MRQGSVMTTTKKTALVILNFKFALPAPILSLHYQYHHKKATPSIPPNLFWIR